MSAVVAKPDVDLAAYSRDLAERAQAASRVLAISSTIVKNTWLRRAAKLLRDNVSSILKANAVDVASAPSFGLDSAAIDRLTLNDKRVEGIAKALEEVAGLPDPSGEIIEGSTRPNGLEIRKVRVPLGVIFFIYESRPNVTADAAAICVKSGNAVILRGGKEAAHSSRAIVELLQQALGECALPADAVQLVDTADRSVVGHLLRLPQYIDVAIPQWLSYIDERVLVHAAYFLATMTSESVQSKVHNMND